APDRHLRRACGPGGRLTARCGCSMKASRASRCAMRTLTGESPALPQLGSLSPAVAGAPERAFAGDALTGDEGAAVMEGPDGKETAALLAVAGHVRDKLKGRTTTYSPKVFLPVTNLCRDYCSYCTFRKDPDDPGAWTMLPEEIRSWSDRAHEQGCI